MKALASTNNFVINKLFDSFSHLDARAHLKSVTDLVPHPVYFKKLPLFSVYSVCDFDNDSDFENGRFCDFVDESSPGYNLRWLRADGFILRICFVGPESLWRKFRPVVRKKIKPLTLAVFYFQKDVTLV